MIKCKECKFWTGVAINNKWRQCENPKSVWCMMYCRDNFSKCKDGEEKK